MTNSVRKNVSEFVNNVCLMILIGQFSHRKSLTNERALQSNMLHLPVNNSKSITQIFLSLIF